jgi:PKD repeat protein
MNWTIYAGGCGYVTYKTLVQFEELNALPPGAVIDYAELRMYGPPSSAMAPQGNSWYPPSNPAPYLKNDGTVKRITSSWSAGIVTWNTAPSNTTSNDEPIPVTSTQWSNNFAIPVTAMTNDMLTYGNNGYWLELNYAYTDIYRSTLFASSYNSNSSLWPELYLKYHLTCDASYGYCSNTNTPNTYSFTANDGTYPYTYTWNFGDGSPTVTGTSVNHTYTSTGSYQVCLTLSQQNQPICEFCEDICVNQIVACPAQRHSKQASTGVISAPIDKVKMDGTISIVSVSPNPTSSNLDVNFKLISESNVSYKVYDMSGKQVLSGNAAMGVGAQKISLSVEKLVPGTYLLEMNDSYTTTNTKFTKE